MNSIYLGILAASGALTAVAVGVLAYRSHGAGKAVTSLPSAIARELAASLGDVAAVRSDHLALAGKVEKELEALRFNVEQQLASNEHHVALELGKAEEERAKARRAEERTRKALKAAETDVYDDGDPDLAQMIEAGARGGGGNATAAPESLAAALWNRRKGR